MNVRVEVELISSPTDADTKDMFASAKHLANNESNIKVNVPDDKPKSIVAEFTIDKARKIDVVDKIGKRFRIYVGNYSQSSISFPKAAARKVQQPASQYTRKQGQYLAFIYYYTKLNGYPPAEADMQKYFMTSAPTVHGMVVQLEKKGFITRKPYAPRSIKLLLSREELPDLE